MQGSPGIAAAQRCSGTEPRRRHSGQAPTEDVVCLMRAVVVVLACSACHMGCRYVQAMRFGNDLEACLKAIQIGFELSPRPSDSTYQAAVKTLELVLYSISTCIWRHPHSSGLCLSK